MFPSCRRSTPTPTAAVNLAAVVEDVRQDLLPLLQETGAQLTVDVPACRPSFSEKNLRISGVQPAQQRPEVPLARPPPRIDVRAHVRPRRQLPCSKCTTTAWASTRATGPRPLQHVPALPRPRRGLPALASTWSSAWSRMPAAASRSTASLGPAPPFSCTCRTRPPRPRRLFLPSVLLWPLFPAPCSSTTTTPPTTSTKPCSAHGHHRHRLVAANGQEALTRCTPTARPAALAHLPGPDSARHENAAHERL